MHLRPETPPHRQAQWTLKELPKVALHESGSIHFKITVESHVALDDHAIVQKWNSYHFQTIPRTPEQFI